MKIRFGDKTIERPFKELAWEALFAIPFALIVWPSIKRFKAFGGH